MENFRIYGPPPCNIAVIHGGPGAAGEMAPVARELARSRSILEPIQTATSIDGQVHELKSVLETNGEIPFILIGYSWGAWLSFIVAAKYPAIVGKLILIGSGGFEEKYAAITRETRMNRLSEEEREEFDSLILKLGDSDEEEKDGLLSRLGEIVSGVDTYDAIGSTADESDMIRTDGDVFQSVWKEAEEMRKSGNLLQLASEIKCPVVAIHGDYDPHPADGVREPLAKALTDFRFILLENCGHTPWIEKQARERFFYILNKEL